MHKPLHPGLLIKDALIGHSGFSIAQAARDMGVARSTLSRLINGKSKLSPAMALKLSELLGTSVESWKNLQDNYDRDTEGGAHGGG